MVGHLNPTEWLLEFSLYFFSRFVMMIDLLLVLTVDNGSGVCKTQFAGENAPRAVLDSGHPGNQV
jgi:hypothetical protein